MYRFGIHRTNAVMQAYLGLFTDSSWDAKAAKFKRLVARTPKLAFLSGLSYKDIFVAPFDTLVEIYYQYIDEQVQASLSKRTKKTLNELFPYRNVRERITEFIESQMALSSPTTCAYCDCHEISYTRGAGIVRNYHLDHYLDKGNCPIVALSLYNLVPVCSQCNRQKGTTPFGNSASATKKLSPYNPLYDFENNTHFKIAFGSIEDIAKIKTSKTYKEMDVSLVYDDEIYKAETSVTHIIDAYYNNKTSVIRDDLSQICGDVLNDKSTIARIFETLRVITPSEKVSLPSNAEHQQGIRVRYDKFKRDIINMYGK